MPNISIIPDAIHGQLGGTLDLVAVKRGTFKKYFICTFTAVSKLTSDIVRGVYYNL